MVSWRRSLVAWVALCLAACHADTETVGRTDSPPLPAQLDSGTACSCSGAPRRSLDCSNRGRSAFSYSDLCNGTTVSVDLSNNSFTAFPSGLGASVLEVNISSNQLTSMPRAPPLNAETTLLDVSDNRISQATDELRALSSLKSLRVNGNRLQTLSFLPEPCALERLAARHNALRSLDGPLRSCSKMKTLDLSYNQMLSLPRGAFSGLRKLEELELVSAGLLNLEGGSFEGLQELQTLDLSSNNLTSFPSLPDGIFSGLQKVKTIGLASNQLEVLPNHLFAGLSSLKSLILSENRLKTLPHDIFTGISDLEFLDLHSNRMDDLPLDLFSGVNSVKVLDMSSNHFISQNFMSSLKSLKSIYRLDLTNNQIDVLPPYDNRMPNITYTSFDNHRILGVGQSTMRSWLNSGDNKRVLNLGSEPMLCSVRSLTWLLLDKIVQRSVASNCKCGSLKQGNAEINFCVNVACPKPTANWLEALHASIPIPPV